MFDSNMEFSRTTRVEPGGTRGRRAGCLTRKETETIMEARWSNGFR